MAGPYELTEDGFESQFGTNHLGHFLFVNKIKAKILASASPRVVCVSSGGHRISDIRYEDLGFSKGETYEKWTAYGQSKTANILTAVGIAERWGIPAFGVHPGGLSFCNKSQSVLIADATPQKSGQTSLDPCLRRIRLPWASLIVMEMFPKTGSTLSRL